MPRGNGTNGREATDKRELYKIGRLDLNRGVKRMGWGSGRGVIHPMPVGYKRCKNWNNGVPTSFCKLRVKVSGQRRKRDRIHPGEVCRFPVLSNFISRFSELRPVDEIRIVQHLHPLLAIILFLHTFYQLSSTLTLSKRIFSTYSINFYDKFFYK